MKKQNHHVAAPIPYEVPEFLPMKGMEASLASWDDWNAAQRTWGLECAFTETMPGELV